MKRWGLVICGFAMWFSGCVVENDPEVMFIQATRLVNRTQKCALKGGGGQVEVIAIGTMDLLQSNRYQLFPTVMNGLSPLEAVMGGSPKSLQLEAHNITITGAWISYRMDGLLGNHLLEVDLDNNGTADILEVDVDADGKPDLKESDLRLPSKVFVPTSGLLEAGSTVSVALEAVPPSVGNLLDMDRSFDKAFSGGILHTTIVVQGYMADGTEVRSSEYHFPIRVCRGCLVVYDAPPQACCNYSTIPTSVPCFPGQDESSSCAVACMVIEGSDRAELKKLMIKKEISDLSAPLPVIPAAE